MIRYQSKLRSSEENGYWTLQSGIIRENIASLTLHKKCGFREIGYREKLGMMDNGKWHDDSAYDEYCRNECWSRRKPCCIR